MFFPADSSLVVSGEAPKDNSCNLTLWDEKGTEEYDKREVSGVFQTSFIVPPYKVGYTIKAVCNNKVTTIYEISENDVTSYERPFNLGNIAP